MVPAKRPRREPTEAWEQLRVIATAPGQQTYELLRPIVLFGRTPAERARETGVPECTLRRKADRFDAVGMASLLETTAPAMTDRRALPAEIRQAILALKAEYPPLRPNEIATICEQRFHRPVGHHTVQRVLAGGPSAATTPRRFPPYRAIADPVERRLAVVRLYLEGWNITSIAGYLATTRPRVYDVLRRWFAEGLPGMEDQSRAETPRAQSRPEDARGDPAPPGQPRAGRLPHQRGPGTAAHLPQPPHLPADPGAAPRSRGGAAGARCAARAPAAPLRRDPPASDLVGR
jgi:hypothetical protein